MTPVPRNRYWWFALLGLGGLAWDLISKSWVFGALGYPGRTSDWSYETDFLWGVFSIRLHTWFNQGALFGLGQGKGWLFASLSVAAAGGILYALFVRGAARSAWLTATLALIFAGAMGNLYDRLYLHGCVHPLSGEALTGVRDFIQCDIPGFQWRWPLRFRLIERYHWPIFNFADSYLVTGAILLTLYSLFSPQEKKAETTDAAPASAAPASAPRVLENVA